MTEIVCVPLRFPVTLSSADELKGLAEDRHLRACLDHPEEQVDWQVADVLYYERPTTEAHLIYQLHAYPGAAVCIGPMTDGQLSAAVRRGHCMACMRMSVGNGLAAANVALMGSLLHAALVSGLFASSDRAELWNGPVVPLDDVFGC